MQLILDTQPAGAKAAGGESKEEVVDKICEDLLARVNPPHPPPPPAQGLQKLAIAATLFQWRMT